MQKFGDVIEQSAITRCIAAILSVETGATAVEERDEIAGLAELGAGVLIPTSVALDTVDAYQMGSRRCETRSIASVAAGITIAHREGFHRIPARGFNQGAAPSVPSHA
jgi:hypothetical protein